VNWLDFFLLFLTGLFVFEGLREGFTRQILGMVATIVGLLLASWFYGAAGSFLLPYVSARAVANIMGFFLVFVGIQLVAALITWVLKRFYKVAGLSWVDRLTGAVFGLVKATLVGIVIVMILLAFPLKPVPASVAHSALAPYLIEASHVLVHLCPGELKDGFIGSYDRVKKLWQSLPGRPKDKGDEEAGEPPKASG